MNYISWIDFLLIPVFLLFAFSIADHFRNKFYKREPHYKYLFPAIVAKLFGTIIFCWLYAFYYEDGGDTTSYHQSASSIVDILTNHPSHFFKAWIGEHNSENLNSISSLGYDVNYWYNFACYNVVRLMVVIELFALKSFFISSLIISGISFIALWKLYLVFVKEFPNQKKSLLIILFVPSILIWSGGILKDTFVLIGLGFFISSFVKLLNMRNIFQNTLGVILSITLIILVKPYVVIILIPCAFWMFYLFKISLITNKVFKLIFRPVIFCLSFILSVYGLYSISGKFGKYTDYEKLEKYAQQSYEGFSSLNKYDQKNVVSYQSSIFNNLDQVPFIMANALGLKQNSNSIIRMFFFFENGIIFFVIIIAVFNLITNMQSIRFNYLVSFSLLFGVLILLVVGYSIANDGALIRLRTPGLLFLIPAITVIGNSKKVI